MSEHDESMLEQIRRLVNREGESAKRVKVGDVVEAYLASKVLRPRSVSGYRVAGQALAECCEFWPVNKAEVAGFVKHLADTNRNDTTRHLYWRMCLTMGESVVDLGGFNGFVGSERPSVVHKNRRYYSQEEMEAIFRRAMKDKADYLMVRVLVDSAVRVSEACAMNVEAIHVGSDGERMLGWFETLDMKTGDRRHRLSPELASELVKYAHGEGRESGPVFVDRTGKRYDAHAMAVHLRYMIRCAGVKGRKLGPHSIRHSVASLILRKTGSLATAQAVLGHDSSRTTELYKHDVDNELMQSVSPLALLAEGSRRMEQMALPAAGETSVEAVGERGVDIIEGTLKDDSFLAEIPEGASVRPLLKSADLALIRRAFKAAFDGVRLPIEDQGLCRSLLSRVLRKAG